MKLRVTTLAVLLCAAAVSMAQAADPKPAGTQPPADSQDEMVCTYEQTTGSHLGHRVCMTRKQRDERAKQDQDALRQFEHAGGNTSRAGH